MSIIGTCPRSFCRMSIHLCPCFGIGALEPGQALPTYSSMTASVHRLQFVHSATSMIMFHFCMALTFSSSPGLTGDPDRDGTFVPAHRDRRVSPLRGGPVMTAYAVISPAPGARL